MIKVYDFQVAVKSTLKPYVETYVLVILILFYLCIVGVGSFVGNIVIIVVEAVTSRAGDGEKWLGNNLNRAHLDYFYWVLAGLSAVNLCVYVWLAIAYVYKKVDEGHLTSSDQQGSGHKKYKPGV